MPASYTMEQLHKMHYHKELLPLHKSLVASGKLTKGTSTKREYIEKRIHGAIGRYDANVDSGMIRSKLKVCEEERERNSSYIQELENAMYKLMRKKTNASI